MTRALIRILGRFAWPPWSRENGRVAVVLGQPVGAPSRQSRICMPDSARYRAPRRSPRAPLPWAGQHRPQPPSTSLRPLPEAGPQSVASTTSVVDLGNSAAGSRAGGSRRQGDQYPTDCGWPSGPAPCQSRVKPDSVVVLLCRTGHQGDCVSTCLESPGRPTGRPSFTSSRHHVSSLDHVGDSAPHRGYRAFPLRSTSVSVKI